VDYVLNQLIETMLAKDREFIAWRQAHPNEVVTPRPSCRPRPAAAAAVTPYPSSDHREASV